MLLEVSLFRSGKNYLSLLSPWWGGIVHSL